MIVCKSSAVEEGTGEASPPSAAKEAEERGQPRSKTSSHNKNFKEPRFSHVEWSEWSPKKVWMCVGENARVCLARSSSTDRRL